MPESTTSKWKDLTSLHKDVRISLEQYIVRYAKNKEKGILTPLIVGPYGSGKTKLMEYLLCFSWNVHIPAIKTDLSIIVEIIRKELRNSNRKKIISESELPQYFAGFFDDKLQEYVENVRQICKDLSENDIDESIRKYKKGYVRGVLLIDEVEEAYKLLKDMVEYSTTPFRGLFNEIYEGKLRVFVIMAFGPSSILMEASSLAGGWRTKLIPIPLISSSIIYNLIKQRIEPNILHINNEILKLMSNTIWWASKGRIAWVRMLIESGFIENIANIINNLNLHEILQSRDILYNESILESLKKEIITGVPLFDMSAYIELLKELNSIERNLFKILVLFAGPIRQDALPKAIKEKLDVIKLNRDYFVETNKIIIATDKLLDKIIDAAKSIASDIIPSLSDIELNRILLDLREILKDVFDSWSGLNYLLLYDLDSINDLKELAISIAFESYKNDVVNILDKIDVSKIIDINQDLVFTDVIKYIAIRPKILLKIYPTIISSPLIACSKNVVDLLGLMKRQKPHQLFDRFVAFWNMFSTNNLEKYMQRSEFYIVCYEKHLDELHKSLLRAVKGGKFIYVIPVGRTGEELLKIYDEIINRFSHFINIGFLQVILPSIKQSLFIIGAIYSSYKCPNELEQLPGIEKYISQQYLKSIENLIEVEMKKWYQGNIWKLANVFRSVDEYTNKLKSEMGKQLGTKQAKYFWLTSLLNDTSKEKLTNTISILSYLRDKLKETYNSIHKLFDIPTDTELKKTYENLRLLSNEKNALKYLELSTKLYNKLFNLDEYIEGYEVFRDLVKVVNDIISNEINCKRMTDRLFVKINNYSDMLGNIIKFYFSSGLGYEESIGFILVGHIIRDFMNKNCKDIYPTVSTISTSLELGIIIKNNNELIEKLQQLYSNLSKWGLDVIRISSYNEIDLLIENLKKIRNSLVNLKNNIVDYFYSKNSLEKLPVFDRILGKEFILDSVIYVFTDNLKKTLSSYIANAKKIVDEILGKLDEINHIVKKLIGKYSSYYESISELDKIVLEEIKNVFVNEFKIIRIDERLDFILNELMKLDDVLSKQERIHRHIDSLSQRIAKINMLIGEQ